MSVFKFTTIVWSASKARSIKVLLSAIWSIKLSCKLSKLTLASSNFVSTVGPISVSK